MLQAGRISFLRDRGLDTRPLVGRRSPGGGGPDAGPNNFIVLRAAAAGGVRGALPAIAGIVLGSVALAGTALAGIGPALTAHPRWRTAVTIGGCAYLCLLGISLFVVKAEAPAQARAAS